ncbi:Protein kinase domain protein [Labilithrix luteola]|uniref:Protein kinase domain protein n=2 Tax=Labilithrix luteola TaxID=1391654 RepID=A0A0K1Q4Z1_9BACT|nr:Protein kinase domain protein [Labilithrix luteola]
MGITLLRAKGVEPFELSSTVRRVEDPRFEWRTVDKKHWQAVAPFGLEPFVAESVVVTDAREANGAGCAPGMVRIKGAFRVGEVERIQDGACSDWISKDFPARCRTFDKEKIASGVSKLPTRGLDFCMDRFEFPNVAGENPLVVVTFHEAEAMCKKTSKRLCTEDEWTFACEGEDAKPYPYGFDRDASACVVDRAWRPFGENAFAIRDGLAAREEVDRLWQGEPSGSRGGCKSSFGVYDMTGNVDEWTRTVRSTGYSSILKGGYWGPVRARCRPSTRAHNEEFVAYQQGFRCCSESNTSVAPPTPPPVSRPLTPLAAADAGVPAGGSGKTADLSPTWPDDHGSDDGSDDEIRAIARARAGALRCSTGLLGDGVASGAGWIAIALGLAAARRARRTSGSRH